MTRPTAHLNPPGMARAGIRGNPLTRERTSGGEPGTPVNMAPVPAMFRCNAKTYNYSVDVNASKKVANFDENRGYFMIQNNGVGNIFVSFGTPARVNRGYLIRPGGYYEPLSAPVSEIYVIGDNGGDLYTVIIGTDV